MTLRIPTESTRPGIPAARPDSHPDSASQAAPRPAPGPAPATGPSDAAPPEAHSETPRGIAARRAALRARWTAKESMLSRIGRLLRFAAKRADEERITQVASSLTFTSVLSMVPLLAVALALFTAFPLFNQFQGALEEYLVTNLMPPSVAQNIMGYLNDFAQKASRLTAIGGVFLVFTALSLMLTIDHALNEIWHVRKARALPQRVLIYWATLTLGPVLMGASLWATSFLARESMGLVGNTLAPLEVLLSFLPMVLTGLAFAALFIVVPNRQVEPRDALTGGFAAAVVLEIMKACFAYYLTRFPSYTVIYGAFATLPIFLLWVYLSWLVTLFGAILAASLPLIRMGRWADERHSGAPFIDAIAILRALITARASKKVGLSTRSLRHRLNLHHEELMTVLDTLSDIGYIVRVGDAGTSRERWALVCDPDTATLEPVFDRLLLDRHQFIKEGAAPLLTAVNSAWVNPKVTLTQALADVDDLPDEHALLNDPLATLDPKVLPAAEQQAS
jgi:membrane protein